MELSIEIFKQLATPFCKNKRKKPKKYSNSYYENFKKYLKLHNLEVIINENNFEKYFLDFCRIHFEDENEIRLEFSDKIKLDLLKRSGGCCAICGTLTIFPMENNKNEALSIGAACHIMPASEYGPRSNVEYRNTNPEKISLIENGLWACLNCHKEIDDNHKMYTINRLKDLKENHELKILKLKESKIDIKKLIDNFEKFSNADYIYIKRDVYEESQTELLKMYKTLKNIEQISVENTSLYQLSKQISKFNKNKDVKYKSIKIDITKDNVDFVVESADPSETIVEMIVEMIEDLVGGNGVDNYKIKNEGSLNNAEIFLFDNKKDLELFMITETGTEIIKINNHSFNVTYVDDKTIIIENNESLVIEFSETSDYYTIIETQDYLECKKSDVLKLKNEENTEFEEVESDFDFDFDDEFDLDFEKMMNDSDYDLESGLEEYLENIKLSSSLNHNALTEIAHVTKINDSRKFEKFLIDNNTSGFITGDFIFMMKYKNTINKLSIKNLEMP